VLGLDLPSVLLEFPVTIIQRADLACLEPARDAVEMEGVLYGVSLSSQGYFLLRKLTLQMPHATVHSSLVAEAWFA